MVDGGSLGHGCSMAKGISSHRSNILPRMGTPGREKAIRPGAGTGNNYCPTGGSPERNRKKVGAIMSAIFKTTREWWLVGLCLLLLLSYFFPQGIELVSPIIDWHGGNRLSMETDMKEYNCGEQVSARFKLQKNRNAVGTIKWELVSDDPGKDQVLLYPARVASAPEGIINHFAQVEKLPDVCAPGKYHFSGTLSYPVYFGTVIYSIRTACFEVKEKGK